jgi:hypothetical protein
MNKWSLRKILFSFLPALAAADRELGTYSWAPRPVLAPFVNNVPAPGRHHNAFINSTFCRSDKKVLMPKPAGVYRIFLTGGSTAYGSGAPDQDRTVGGYLQNLLNRRPWKTEGRSFEVFTLANVAWTTTHERIAIENIICFLKPDLVISLSGNNEMHWGWKGRNIFWLSTYPDEYFRTLVNMTYEKSGLPPLPEIKVDESQPVSPDKVASRARWNVLLSIDALRRVNAEYVFFLQPNIKVTSKPLSRRESQVLENWSNDKAYVEKCYSRLEISLSGINAENYHFFRADPAFRNMNKSNEVFLDTSHFGDRGNELLAIHILESLKPLLLESSPASALSSSGTGAG